MRSAALSRAWCLPRKTGESACACASVWKPYSRRIHCIAGWRSRVFAAAAEASAAVGTSTATGTSRQPRPLPLSGRPPPPRSLPRPRTSLQPRLFPSVGGEAHGNTRSPFVTSGIRLGSAAATTRVFTSEEFHEIGGLIALVVFAPQDARERMCVRKRVETLLEAHPLYPGMA